MIDLDLTTTSRVELEHLLLSLLTKDGREFDVAAIRAELSHRTWQNVNPYA